MRRRFSRWVEALRQKVRWLSERSVERNFSREFHAKSNEEFWRRRERMHGCRARLANQWKRVVRILVRKPGNDGVLSKTLRSVVWSSLMGALILAAVLTTEWYVSRTILPSVIPQNDEESLLLRFPTLAVQVSASLLGFYLASVSIVLGRSYSDVSASVRELVLGNARSRAYLTVIGAAIGAGLILILVRSLGLSFGYISISVYALLVLLAGWAFGRLAFGAFDLFNPGLLSREPLSILNQAISQLRKENSIVQESALPGGAERAYRSLTILAELIDLTRGRNSTDRNSLAQVVELLLTLVSVYSSRKHLIPLSSSWFLPEAYYPKWVEADSSVMALRLQTSTSLPPRYEPGLNWLESRSGELVAAVLETSIVENDRDMVVRIGNVIGATTRNLARNYRLDEAILMAEIIRNRCSKVRAENEALVVAATLPPLILTSILLGWRDAVSAWPEEIKRSVGSATFDGTLQGGMVLRGPLRVWRATQRLNEEIRAEHGLHGRRVTPDWYLEYALAGECILAVREFADRLPEILANLTGQNTLSSSGELLASGSLHALETTAKARDTVISNGEAVRLLETLRRGHDLEATDELDVVTERVAAHQTELLRSIAVAIDDLNPSRNTTEPDRFGHAFFVLIHHTERAVATGDVSLVTDIFPHLLNATMRLFEYLRSTYIPPTYRLNSTIVDPIVDLLEISGLAMIYGEIRNDESTERVKEAWDRYFGAFPDATQPAKSLLDLLDVGEEGLSLGLTPRSSARAEWERSLISEVRSSGYARPAHNPLGGTPNWSAPPLIKMLGVSEDMPYLSFRPRSCFAVWYLGPLSGESEEQLRSREALRRYFQARDSRGTTRD